MGYEALTTSRQRSFKQVMSAWDRWVLTILPLCSFPNLNCLRHYRRQLATICLEPALE